jgi:LysM repeat protein
LDFTGNLKKLPCLNIKGHPKLNIMNKIKPTLMVLFNLLILLGLCFAVPQDAQAQSGTPAGVLAEINAYRADNGLGPLVENQYLNIAAQNHANWMAEKMEFGHEGEGGGTYTDRALAAGYGEGLGVRVTENWARGHQMTAYEVVHNSWKPSGIHNSQMLTTSYNEFGAGVALDGDGMTVYVVVFGIVTGGDLAPVATLSEEPTAAPVGPTPTPVPISETITTATPNPNGSVVHVVTSGQALAAIADAYDIPLADLLTQNNLTEDSVIYPEQELLIVPAALPSLTLTEAFQTPEETLEPTPSPSPTPTEKVQPTRITPTPTLPPQKHSSFLTDIFSGDTLWIGIGLVSVSVLGMGLLFFTSSKLD